MHHQSYQGELKTTVVLPWYMFLWEHQYKTLLYCRELVSPSKNLCAVFFYLSWTFPHLGDVCSETLLCAWNLFFEVQHGRFGLSAWSMLVWAVAFQTAVLVDENPFCCGCASSIPSAARLFCWCTAVRCLGVLVREKYFCFYWCVIVVDLKW